MKGALLRPLTSSNLMEAAVVAAMTGSQAIITNHTLLNTNRRTDKDDLTAGPKISSNNNNNRDRIEGIIIIQKETT
jgi:hypothetical protein